MDLDLDELLNDYYVLYFGPAAVEMKALFQFVEAGYIQMPHDQALIEGFQTRLSHAQGEVPPDSVYAWRINLIADAYAERLAAKLESLALVREVSETWGSVVDNGQVTMDGILEDAVCQGVPVFSLHDRKTGEVSDTLNSTSTSGPRGMEY